MKTIPVKFEAEGKWISAKIGIDETTIHLPEPINTQIPIKSIDNVQQRKNLLTISVAEKDYRIATVPKALAILKRVILMGCSGYRLMAFFMSPAIRGGVMVSDAKWEKGAVTVLKTGIWFVSQNHQICIPIADVSAIEQTKREVQGTDKEVVKIDHVESGDVSTSFVLCPATTLQVLYNYLTDATKDSSLDGELDPLSGQVAMLVYSGMDTHSIEGMLEKSQRDIDAVYDRMLGLGLVEVVQTRREVKLTTKGVRFVTEAVKPPTPQ
ncbi:CheF family chemotaxis protein [Methanogenium cariaci]|jgi:taxis protein CheF